MGCPPLCVLLVLLTITTDVGAQTLVASKNPLAVNSSVSLRLSPETEIEAGTWLHISTSILMWYPGENGVIIYMWKDRITFNKTSSELSIRALQVNDSGLYVLQGKTQTGNIRATVDLKVQEIVEGATLQVNSTSLVELNDTAVFNCSVSAGSALSYLWLNGSSEVTANLVQLDNLGAILRIPQVTRYDQGPFRCNVSNDISSDVSQSIHLSISYGPSDLVMMAHPKMAAYKTGTNITLSCSAQSKPSATYQWSLERRSLNQDGPQLHLWSPRQNQTGSYTCLAHNSVTLRFAHVTTMIRIVDTISSVSVSLSGKAPILNDSFTLSCDVSGPVDHIYWRKNDKTISADHSTVFSAGNKTVTFNPVQHSDNGHYTCEAFNAVSNMTSAPYRVLVNYGPDKPVIRGEAIALNGSSVTLTCSASSEPPSVFSWYFNGSHVASGPEYETGPLTLDDDGYYTCEAFNNVTDRKSTASKMLTVIDPVTMATVKVGAQPIENHTFRLSCEATGSVESIYWLKDGRYLHPDQRTFLSMDNKTFTFNPVLPSDNGEYQCVASNPLTNKTSDNYTLLVNYGPEKPVIVGPGVAMTGQRVTLTCSASSRPPSVFSWYFNGSHVASGPEYETGPLTLDDHGYYTCEAFNNVTDRNSTASKMLTVVPPITQVHIRSPLKAAIEGQSFTLSCDATRRADNIHWWKDHRALDADDRTVFSMNNRTVTINPIQRSDTGDYTCQAFNAVSNKTSAVYPLLVNYGPDEPVIVGPEVAITDHNVTLTCSASSEPPSVFSWYFNGSHVASGPEYETGPLTLDDHGYYTCEAFNNITDRNSTASKMLTVIAPLTSASISVDGRPAVLNEPFTMTCAVVGKPTSILWMKDGWDLHPNDRTVFSPGNTTLSFNSVHHSDQGNYTCQATNVANNKMSPEYKLIVNFGPEQPVIDGPAVGETGQRVTLTCSASSRPPSVFSWYFNGSHVASGPEYKTGNLTFDDQGNYICEAFNNVTDRNSTASKMLTVIGAIQYVTIKPNATPINLDKLTLTCDVGGPSTSFIYIFWMKDNNPIMNTSVDPKIPLNSDSLHFDPVTVSDDGQYQCVVSDPAPPHFSPPYQLLVNYGPLSIDISGPISVVIGTVSTVSLKCSADSRPISQYEWFFQHKLGEEPISLGTGHTLTVMVTLEQSGNYTCKATNPVTQISMSTTQKMLFSGGPAVLPLQTKGGLMLMLLVTLSLCVFNNELLY